MAENGGLHGLKLFVPHIIAAAGAEQLCAPEFLVNLHGIFVRAKAFPLVEDRAAFAPCAGPGIIGQVRYGYTCSDAAPGG